MKLNLVLAACFAAFWGFSALYFSTQAERLIDDVVSHEARMQMQASTAVRTYTQDQVKPYFDANIGLGFHAFTVPAFASKTVLSLMYASFPGYRYREVALNPTNPASLPNDWEREQIMAFRKPGAVLGEVTVVHSKDEATLHAILPVRIENPSCLQCHGRPEDAPREMIARYGNMGGFGWQLGEVVGAQIVTVPKTLHRARFAQQRRDFTVALLAIFGLLFLSSNVLFHRVVVRPMDRRNRMLRELANTDVLTRVANRRAFDRRLATTISQARDTRAAVSVLMLDIDHFKQVNDTFGHAGGDRVLRSLARELPRAIPSSGLFARLGGEEFGVLLAGVNQSEALSLASTLRERCAELDVGIGRPVTISVGAAQMKAGESAAELLRRCDAALYNAKAAGRNVVMAAQ